MARRDPYRRQMRRARRAMRRRNGNDPFQLVILGPDEPLGLIALAAASRWAYRHRTAFVPFGITTTIVNPGFFRTELLTERSTNYAETSIEDYDERRAKQIEFWKAQNGKQSGDPAKLARALIMIGSQEPPPRRFIAGANAIATAEQKIADLKAQIDANRDLSTSLAFD